MLELKAKKIRKWSDQMWGEPDKFGTEFLKTASLDDFDLMFKSLESPYAWIRALAAEALGEIGDSKAFKKLAGLLDDDWRVVKSAIEAIGLMELKPSEKKKAEEELINRLEDRDPRVRCQAARTLGVLKSANAVQNLIEHLLDPITQVRCAAADALGEIDTEKAIQPFIESLKDRYWVVESDDDTPRVNLLFRALKSLKGDDLVLAIRTLGDMKDPGIVNPLLELIGSADNDIALVAVKALGNIKDERILDPLLALYKKWDKNRAVIIEAVQELRDPRLQDVLLDALDEDDTDVQIAAARGLGRFDDAKVSKKLVTKLKERKPKLREAIEESLLAIGDERVVIYLQQLLSERKLDIEGRKHIEEIILKVKKNESRESIEEKIQKRLQIPVDDVPDFSVRTLNCFKREDINNIGDVIKFTAEQLLNIRNFGAKSLREVRDVVRNYGLTLAESPNKEGPENRENA